MKRYIFLILIILTLLEGVKGQNHNLDKSIVQIIKAFSSKNTQLLNYYIHPNYGVITLFRRGVMDEYQKNKTIDFNNPIPEYLPYFPFNPNLKLNYQSLPIFNYETQKWSKVGLYCDTTKQHRLVSKIALNLKKYQQRNISKQTIESLKIIEDNSHRVVLIDKHGGEFIFYITLIGKKWYLTIIDRVSSDCSA